MSQSHHSALDWQAFSVRGPTVWNSLPVELREPAVSNGVFRRTLKDDPVRESAPSAIEMLCVKLCYKNSF